MRRTKNITIFVHGTLMPALAILNPYKTYTQTLDKNDMYYKCVTKLRKNPQIFEDSITLNEGFEKIDPAILFEYKQRTLIPGNSKKGAYQAIGAYDTIYQKICFDKNIDREYYTFGHCGILSDEYRKETSLALYKEIVNLIKNCHEKNVIPQITLCGYSHGGNIILYLGMMEMLEKQNISIDKVILFGTPIQAETAIYAHNNIFKKIINIYSEGDTIQNGDSISTSSSISYRTFQELYKNKIQEFANFNPKHIIDVRILAHEDSTFFNHYSYWFFQRYDQPWFGKNKPEIQEIIKNLDPLPLAILTPIFVYLIDQIKNSSQLLQLDLIIKATENEFNISIREPGTKQIFIQSDNIKHIINKIIMYAKNSWTPYAQANETKRIGLGIISAINTLAT